MILKASKRAIVIAVTFLFLISCESEKASHTEMAILLETTESWNGKQLPDYSSQKPEITILRAYIPSNSRLEPHKHSAINAAVVLKGELTVITEQKDTLKVTGGEAFAEVVDTWHYGINNGKTPVEVIIFYAGAEGMTNTILKTTDQSQ